MSIAPTWLQGPCDLNALKHVVDAVRSPSARRHRPLGLAVAVAAVVVLVGLLVRHA